MVIKGVNKCVIEIHDTGNEYFEKAIFFVRPEYSLDSEQHLRTKASRLLEQTAPPPATEKIRKENRGKRFLVAALSAAAGALFSGILAFFF